MKKLFTAVALVAASVCGVANAGIIDTTAGWDGVSSIGSFGQPDSATYGQTFLVSGSDTQLDSWTFYLNDSLNTGFVDFAFYVMDWNAGTNMATGSILFQSAAVTTSNNGGADGMEAFTFNTGGLNLVSGNDYIAFISATGLFNAENGTAIAGSLRNESAYLDGGFYWQNNGNSAGTWDTQGWSSSSGFGDLAFTAVFNANSSADIPVPATFALFGLGLIALGASRKQKA